MYEQFLNFPKVQGLQVHQQRQRRQRKRRQRKLQRLPSTNIGKITISNHRTYI